MPEYKNFSLAECDKTLRKIMREHPHAAFFQKWTCGGCGQRITGNAPNKLFILGHCEDCGHLTDLQKTGCNYSLHLAVGGVTDMPAKGNA